MEAQKNSFDLISLRIAHWAQQTPEATALIFLDDGEHETERLTYAQLHQRASTIAHQLKERKLVGERVLLLFHSSIDYVCAFFGCLYAGAIAVPVYPPRNNYHARRVAAIAQDAQAHVVLCSADLHSDISNKMAQLSDAAALNVVSLNDLESTFAGLWSNPQIQAEELAYLQYTSGSTGSPKGVMVSHANLIHNCHYSQQALGLPSQCCVTSWLPMFHDMGLVHGICLPLSIGGTAVFMPSPAFIQKPLRWLKAIGHYRAVYTPAPNFAYELCATKISSTEAASLDLSSWKVGINGAEPILYSTLEKFKQQFAISGFDPSTFTCGYGLAETTLMVTCGKYGEVSHVIYIDAEAIKQNQIKFLNPDHPRAKPQVSSGWISSDPHVRIVSPSEMQACGDTQVGEIWVSGGSNCGGYWCRPNESREIFEATLADAPRVSYIRTGDLGFTHGGQLYITGRLKDLVIIRGANHYPQDLEFTAENAHAALRNGGWAAAFTLDDTAEPPQLVIVIEVERTQRKKIDVQQVGVAIMRAVTEQHGIDVDQVVLIEPGGIPKTSSGKIQRRPCKSLLLANELPEIGRWLRLSASAPHEAKSTRTDADAIATQASIETMLRAAVARLSGIASEQVNSQLAFTSLGLNSIKVVELITELGLSLNLDLAPTLAFEYPTVETLASYLAAILNGNPDAAPDVSQTADSQTGGRFQAVAVIGMSCRLPGANNPEEFWELIKHGRCSVTEISTARTELSNFEYEADDAFRFGGFLSDIEQFDASLFGISPREAESIDPQQRLLLETTWHAIESSNIPIDQLTGSATGVFVGVSVNDYFRLQRKSGAGQDTYSGTGSALSIAANRISYCFGLQGPSMAIDTACSSSLVAVHTACRSLANGESTLAIAGGVNLVLSSDYGTIFDQAQMLSPSGACHTFSENADGYVRGEGCGVLVLKLLSEAQKDGDTILGVIRGSAVNQDGASNGLTAPNAQAQQAVIRAALRCAGLEPSHIAYVETHGTGTPLGDPIEISALHQVYLNKISENEKPQAVWLGALKPNIGHLESAAGIAGLIKTLLVLQHGEIPPLSVEGALNEKIVLAGSRLEIPCQLQVWDKSIDTEVRRAGVSSFGFGGTNAHVIVESAPASQFIERSLSALPSQLDSPPSYLLMISANSRTSLRALAQLYATQIANADESTLSAICQAAYANRRHLSERLCVTGTCQTDLVQDLRRYAAGEHSALPPASYGRAERHQRIAFLFTGQGAQYAGMGEDLYRAEPIFQEFIDRCDTILTPLLEHSIKEIMFGKATILLDDTRYAQVALIVLELGLVALWRVYGIEPEFVCGHSVGEYAAACVAGILSLEDTLKLVVERGRLMAQAGGQGAMLTVNTSQAKLEQWLTSSASSLEIAAYNSPEQFVLSGNTREIDTALVEFNSQGIAATKLAVSHAFHSRLMQNVCSDFQAVLQTVQFHRPTLRMFATGMTNDGSVHKLSEIAIHADYWRDQIRQPVRFMQAIKAMAEVGADCFIELGPLPVLRKLAAQSVKNFVGFDSIQKGSQQVLHLQKTVGALFVRGVQIQPKSFGARSTLHLPQYVFDHKPYWFAQGKLQSKTKYQPKTTAKTFAGERIEIAVDGLICYHTALPNQTTSFLEDHRLRGKSIMPGAGYVSLILSAISAARRNDATCFGTLILGDGKINLRDIEFIKPLDLSRGEVFVQTILQRQNSTQTSEIWEAKILARADEKQSWEMFASARVEAARSTKLDEQQLSPLVVEGASINIADFYRKLAQQGLEYGPGFQAIKHLQLQEKTIRAKLSVPDSVDVDAGGDTPMHTSLIDAAFQCLSTLLSQDAEYSGLTPLPIKIDQFHLILPAAGELLLSAQIRSPIAYTQDISTVSPIRASSLDDAIVADLFLHNAQSQLVTRIRGLRLKMLELDVLLDTLLEIPQVHPAQTLQTQWQLDESLHTRPKELSPARWYTITEDDTTRAIHAQLETFAVLTPLFSQSAEPQAAIPHLVAHNAARISQSAGIIFSLPEDSGADIQVHHARQLCKQLQQLLVALDANPDIPDGFKVCLITRSCTGLHGDEQINVSHAGVAAMLRCAALELPALRLLHIDLPASPTTDDLMILERALSKIDEENEDSHFTIRDGLLFVPRLHAVPDSLKGNTLILSRNASYLITGGTGGLGLSLADHLAKAGAGRIILASRHACLNKQISSLIEYWRKNGVEIVQRAVDIAQESAVSALCTQLDQDALPLRGVFHAAGVLQDRPLADIDQAAWREVFAAKAQGAILLDRYTRASPLDYFVLFSSIAASFGSAGQCNYGAANGILDALAFQRQREGRCATTINWGPWGLVGMASAPELSRRLARQGMLALDPTSALTAMNDALTNLRPQSIIAAIDWSIFPASLNLKKTPAFFREVLQASLQNQSTSTLISPQLPSPEELANTNPEAARLAIRIALASLIKQVLRMSDGGVLDVADPRTVLLSSLGIDSLLAMELRNRVRAWVNADLAAHLLIGNNTLEMVADQIYQKVLLASLSVQSQNSQGDIETDTEEFVL